MLEPHICFKARMSRDYRFDGKFYTAVMTTGIFCRPICPARAAKEENVRYFENAASAQDAGFKPCKRCFPEQAPEQVLSLQMKRLSHALLSDVDPIAEIANKLGYSERQFRRIFTEYFGIAPKQYRLHQNLLLARKLLKTSALAISDVCFASGFTSLRSFNEHMKAIYGATPREYRSQQRNLVQDTSVNIKLSYRPPLDFSAMLSFFQLRQLTGIEKVTDNSYQRTINIAGKTGWIKVTELNGENALNLKVVIDDYSLLNNVILKVRKMFDLDADMNAITEHLSKDELLAPLVQKYQGIRLPGCWDIFEFSIRAILGQQISVKAATTLAGRIAEKYGKPLNSTNESLSYCFPIPEDMREVNFDNMGLTQSRIQTLHTWLTFYQENPNVLEQYSTIEDLERRLTALKGIGPWTVNYIAMRGLSDPNAFPAADLGVIKALAPDLNRQMANPPASVNAKTAAKYKTKDLIARAQSWQPWRAYATIYLWLSLSENTN